jgi:hypothetical protein
MDTENLSNNQNPPHLNRKHYEQLMALLIWGIAVVVGFGGLYLLGLWVDHDL